jgi:putative peptidoglycan lipid II flippase
LEGCTRADEIVPVSAEHAIEKDAGTLGDNMRRRRPGDHPLPDHSVGRLATLSLIAGVVDRLLGLVLIAILAGLFGASSATDTYFLALVVPLTLAIALSEAFYTAMISPFAERASVISLRPALVATLCIVSVVSATYALVILGFAPADIGVWLAFIPVIPSMTVASVYAAWFVSQRRYVLAVFRIPLATLVGLLLLAAVIPLTTDMRLVALAVSAGHVASVLLLAARAGTGDSNPRYMTVNAVRMLRGVPAVLTSTIVGGLAFVLTERLLAVSLAVGSIAVLAFARGISQAPAMIAFALGNGLLPAAAEYHRAADSTALLRISTIAFRLALLACTAAAAFLVICRDDLVGLLIHHGSLSASAAADTAILVSIFALALPGTAATAVASKGLFALGEQRRVAQASLLALGVYVPTALALREIGGTKGLAAAFGLVSIGSGALLAALYARRLNLGIAGGIRRWTVAPLCFAALFGVGAYAGSLLALPATLAEVGPLVASALGGGVTLLLAVVVAHGPERRLLSEHLGLARSAG